MISPLLTGLPSRLIDNQWACKTGAIVSLCILFLYQMPGYCSDADVNRAVAGKSEQSAKLLGKKAAGLSSLPARLSGEIPDTGKRFALVIGNAKYRYVPTLDNPGNDSEDICAALKDLRFVTDCRKNVPTRKNLRDAVAEFTRKLGPEDVALFYFAGHGIEVDGENYLIPTEADIRKKTYVEDETLRVGFVFDELRSAGARLSIIILDACRNNPFNRVRSTVGTGLAIPSSLPSGSIIIFPTAPGKTALDGDGRNGIFTKHFLGNIKTGGITIEDMFKRVIHGVSSDAKQLGGEQIPWMNLSFTGEFCFVGCGTRVNTDEYLAMVRQKELIEATTRSLQSELDARQGEVALFKERMVTLERALEGQRASASLSKDELMRIDREKAELAAKSLQISAQEEELRRVKSELSKLESKKLEFSRSEKEVAAANERIAHLEQQIALQFERKIDLNQNELVAIKHERDELLARNRELQQMQIEVTSAKTELESLRNKLAKYDQHRKELDEYKVRMARLEAESRQKDDSVRQLRTELENRQGELTSFRDRMAILQRQLDEQKTTPRLSEFDLNQLKREREGLAAKTEQLAAREQEIKEAQKKLAALEANRTVAARREQDIAAHAERIVQLEAELARSQKGRFSPDELNTLRRERDELRQRNQELQRQQPEQDRSRQEFLAVQGRLAEYDREKVQWDSYKNQLSSLERRHQEMQKELSVERSRRKETEEKLKDAATRTVRDAAFVAPAL